MNNNLGKYPTLLEIDMGRKMTSEDYEQMNEDYEKASRAYDEYIRTKILAEVES